MVEKAGYLGPEGSYSFLAAQTLCKGATWLPYAGFPQMLSALDNGEIDGAVIPIENTLNGGVLQNIDLLQSAQGVVAVGATTVKIDHRLFTLQGANISKITTVYSHGQALAQCAHYLFTHFPQAKLIATQSTSGSLALVKNPTEAAIAGSHLHPANLTMWQECISDEPNNFTHFLLLVKGQISEDTHSSRVYFSVVCAHHPGALLGILGIIAAYGLNMTKIESRPIKNSVGEYRFFLEADGDYASPHVRNALQAVKNAALSFKLLGVY
jgi:prephenate dehydratase